MSVERLFTSGSSFNQTNAGSRVRKVHTENKMNIFNKDKISIGNTGKFFPEVLRQSLCLTETVLQSWLLGCITGTTGRNSVFCHLGGQVNIFIAVHSGDNLYKSMNFSSQMRTETKHKQQPIL